MGLAPALPSAAYINFPPCGIDVQAIRVHLGLTRGVVFLFHIHHNAHDQARALTRAGARSSARRAAERVRGSGGWGRVVLNRNVLDAAQGIVGYMVEAREGYVYGRWWERGHGVLWRRYQRVCWRRHEQQRGCVRREQDWEREYEQAYEVIEFAGGWNVVPDGATYGARGPETNEDVDVVGDADVGTPYRTHRERKDRLRGNTQRRESRREQVPESIFLPKMQKRWKDAGGVTLVQTPAPPRVDKGKGKARAQLEEAVDLDVDVVAIDAACAVPAAEVVARPTSTAAALPFPTRTAAGGTVFGAVAQYEFRALEPHAATSRCRWPRPAWFSVGAGANVEVLEHDGNARAMHRKEGPAVEMLPPADVYPSSRICFVEPVTDVLHRDAHVESLGDDREHDDDALLLAVGEEEPYRLSPASPSPAPKSEEEPDVQLDIPPRVLADEEVVGRFADNGAAALACVGYRRIALVRPSRAGSASVRPIAAARGHPSTSSRGQGVVPGVTGASEAGAREGGRGGAGARAREAEGTGARAGRQREREKDTAQGEDKENEVVPVGVPALLLFGPVFEVGSGSASHARDVPLLFGPVLEVGAGHTP
ncbi:hypothetical protein B0H14DRAFT_3771596 [Mycena olivaceomarginata]|nr:hypothetical protein B0H14DRAFT_3771596 [Mycena olivaceomarginata]